MTTLWVSETVWKAIRDKKNIGDTADTVLRRLLGLDPQKSEIGPDGEIKIQGE